jgi:hypothetical protein
MIHFEGVRQGNNAENIKYNDALNSLPFGAIVK